MNVLIVFAAVCTNVQPPDPSPNMLPTATPHEIQHPEENVDLIFSILDANYIEMVGHFSILDWGITAVSIRVSGKCFFSIV